jgi:hypothetical protein
MFRGQIRRNLTVLLPAIVSSVPNIRIVIEEYARALDPGHYLTR